jgi:4-carboxymuconolactone decarboxylase
MRGEAIRELGAGDSDFTGPGVPHWHGAAPDATTVQTSMSFGGIGPWLEPVTDEEYLGTTNASAEAGE